MSHELTGLMIAVDTFAAVMKRKLLKKAGEGATGWDNPDERGGIQNRLQEATRKLLMGDTRQAVDVANLAMFLAFQSGWQAFELPPYPDAGKAFVINDAKQILAGEDKDSGESRDNGDGTSFGWFKMRKKKPGEELRL